MLNNDYDYTIDKYLIPKIRLRCPNHNKEQAQFICTDNTCKRSSIICKSCQFDNDAHYREHKSSFKNIDAFLVEATNDMENYTTVNKQILQEIYSQTPNLQKWQDDDEMHLSKVSAHIQAQKAVIDEDMSTLSSLILSNLDVIREKLYSRLDQFYRSYCETFNKQKTSLNESFGLAKNFYLYMNPANLAAKLQSEMPLQASQFISQLNKSIDKAKTIQLNKATFVQSFRAINSQLNKMTDNLPFYLPNDQMSQQLQAVTKIIETFFNKNINIADESDLSAQNLQKQPSQQPQQSSSSSSSSSNGQIQNAANNNLNVVNNNNVSNNAIGNYNGAIGNAAPPTLPLLSNNYVSNTNNPTFMKQPSYQGSNQNLNNNNNNINVSNNTGSKKQFKISKNGKQMQLKNTDQNISIKPVKKFQLEIPICSIASLSETQFALASANDSRIRFFESQNKKMHTFPAHQNSITCITKIKAVFDPQTDQVNPAPKYDQISQQSNIGNENQKTILIASSSCDMTVLIMKYDLEKQSQPTFYQKISGFTATPQYIVDMQDGIHIATGDSFGDVQIWNYHEGRLAHPVKGKHSGKIIGIYLVKGQKKLIIASDDTISVWKYSYLPITQSSVAQIDRLVQETHIQSDPQLGRISCFLPSYRDNLCFIGNNDGEIIIYDLTTRRCLSKWNAHGHVPVIDLCIFEFEGKRDVGTLVSLGLSDRQIKTWKINAQEERNTFSVEDAVILDGNSTNDDIQSKNKLQVVQASCPKLVIANERDKELLLYNLIL